MDTTIIHADIFFYITTIIVIILGFLFSLILLYIVSIARRFSKIAKRLERESEHLAGDIAHIRHTIREEASKVTGLWKFLTGFMLNPFAAEEKESHSPHGRRSSYNSSKKKKKNLSSRLYKKTAGDEDDEVAEVLEDISDIQ